MRPALSGPRTLLRLPTPGDVDELVSFYARNQAHFAPTSPTQHAEPDPHSHWRRRVDEFEREYETDRGLRFLVFRADQPRRIIGVVSFTQFNRGAAQMCYLGYGIDAQEQGKGLMREALELSHAHIFGPVNMHRVMANYLPTNERSGALLRRLGFVVEGYARDYLCINGQWRDHILTSLTNPHWHPE